MVPDLCPDGLKKYERVVYFFENILRHSKGQNAGKPFKLLPWQHHVMRELFGRLNHDGTRQHRVGYIELPKKQGKSTTLAGLALYLTGFDGEKGAECYGAASDREQAGIIYREAASMVRASPALSRYFDVIDSRKTIAHKASGSFYRVLSADAFRAEGLACAPRASAWGAQAGLTEHPRATLRRAARPAGPSPLGCPAVRRRGPASAAAAVNHDGRL